MGKQRQARLGGPVRALSTWKGNLAMESNFRGSPSAPRGPNSSRNGSGAPSLQKDPSLLMQTKVPLDVISDGQETQDVMWKHVVCREELTHDFLHTAGAIPMLISFPGRVF